MVDTGLIALGLGVGGTYVATQTDILGSGSQSGENQRSIMGGFSPSGRGVSPVGGGYGVPSTVVNKKVNYSPTSVNKTVNVNTQPRAGSTKTTTKKEDKSGGSSNDSGGSSGGSSVDLSTNTKKESNRTNDISRGAGQDDSGDGSPYTDTGAFASDTAGVQSTKKDKVTQELDVQQGKTRSMTTAEMENSPLDNLGGQTKKENKASSQFGQGSITSGDFFRGSIF